MENNSQAKILSFELGQPQRKAPDQKQKPTKKYPEKAIQSLFRTTSKNTYHLYESVDRKANILISINAIILSVLLSTTYAQGLVIGVSNLHWATLVFFSSLSILLALIAVKPFIIKPEKIGMKENTMINLAAIQTLSLEYYKDKANGIIKSEKSIYNSMMEDMYFIGKNVVSKHKFLQWSTYLFLGGLVLSAIIMIAGMGF